MALTLKPVDDLIAAIKALHSVSNRPVPKPVKKRKTCDCPPLLPYMTPEGRHASEIEAAEADVRRHARLVFFGTLSDSHRPLHIGSTTEAIIKEAVLDKLYKELKITVTFREVRTMRVTVHAPNPQGYAAHMQQPHNQNGFQRHNTDTSVEYYGRLHTANGVFDF